MAGKTHVFLTATLLTGLAVGMCGAAFAQSPLRKPAGFLPVALPLAALQNPNPPAPAGLTTVAAGESSAQPVEAPVDMNKADATWRLSPAQRAVLREQVRRSAARNVRCPQCRPE